MWIWSTSPAFIGHSPVSANNTNETHLRMMSVARKYELQVKAFKQFDWKEFLIFYLLDSVFFTLIRFTACRTHIQMKMWKEITVSGKSFWLMLPSHCCCCCRWLLVSLYLPSPTSEPNHHFNQNKMFVLVRTSYYLSSILSIDWIPLKMNTPWPFKHGIVSGHRSHSLRPFNQKRSSSKPFASTFVLILIRFSLNRIDRFVIGLCMCMWWRDYKFLFSSLSQLNEDIYKKIYSLMCALIKFRYFD